MAITKIQSESLNLADTYAFTGTVTGAGGNNQPYFTAYQTGDYSVSHNTATTIVLPNTTVNSGSDYNTSTGRFTPQVAGDYFVTASSTSKHGSSGNAIVYWSLYIQKNSAYTDLRADTGNEATSTVAQSNTNISGIISMNGSTDYLTFLAYQYDYSANAAQNLRKIQFSAFKII